LCSNGHPLLLAGDGQWDKMPVVEGFSSPLYCGYHDS
jgi:hypothetical protein